MLPLIENAICGTLDACHVTIAATLRTARAMSSDVDRVSTKVKTQKKDDWRLDRGRRI